MAAPCGPAGGRRFEAAESRRAGARAGLHVIAPKNALEASAATAGLRPSPSRGSGPPVPSWAATVTGEGWLTAANANVYPQGGGSVKAPERKKRDCLRPTETAARLATVAGEAALPDEDPSPPSAGAPDGGGAPAVSVKGLASPDGDVTGPRRRRSRRPRGHRARPARPQRGRQDDHDPGPHDAAQADAGSASGGGPRRRPRRRRAAGRIGLAGQYAAVDENLTGQENLTMVGPPVRHVAGPPGAALASCSSASTWPGPPDGVVKTYSGGMRRRLDLAAALVANPRPVPRRAHHRP